MLDFLQDLDLGVFSQIALIECTTDGDLEYFFGYGIEYLYPTLGMVYPAWCKKNIFFLCTLNIYKFQQH